MSSTRLKCVCVCVSGSFNRLSTSLASQFRTVANNNPITTTNHPRNLNQPAKPTTTTVSPEKNTKPSSKNGP